MMHAMLLDELLQNTKSSGKSVRLRGVQLILKIQCQILRITQLNKILANIRKNTLNLCSENCSLLGAPDAPETRSNIYQFNNATGSFEFLDPAMCFSMRSYEIIDRSNPRFCREAKQDGRSSIDFCHGVQQDPLFYAEIYCEIQRYHGPFHWIHQHV